RRYRSRPIPTLSPYTTLFRSDEIAGRVVLDQLDVGDEGRARQRAFDQVVAEHGILGDAVLERRFHGVDVVKPLAGEGALAEQVLDRKSTRLNSSHVKISYAVF